MWTFGGGGGGEGPDRQRSGGSPELERSPESVNSGLGGSGDVRRGGTPPASHGFVELGEDEEPPAGRQLWGAGSGEEGGLHEHTHSPPSLSPQHPAPAVRGAAALPGAGGSPLSQRASPPDAAPHLILHASNSPQNVRINIAPGSDGRASSTSASGQHLAGQHNRSFSQRVRRPSLENILMEFARTSSLMVSRVSGLTRGDDSSEEEAEGGGNEYASAGQSTLEDHLKLRALEKDMSFLNILQFSASMECTMRTDMNRFTLLEECRKSFPQDRPADGGKRAGKKRRQPEMSLGAALQLRDIRCLQGVSEPALLVRRGAIVVSLDPIKAIVTCDTCFVVIPDGADELLEPLMGRLREGNKDVTVEMPFEFVALEALLVTLVQSHARDVKRRLQDSRTLLRSLKSGITNKMLNRILTLKKAIDEMYEAVIGCHETLEEVQGDDDLMGLMYLTAQKEGRRNHKNTHYSVMQAELLLDAYAIDFLSMAKQLSLMSKEIDATEAFLKCKLDKAHNRLITLDVMLTRTRTHPQIDATEDFLKFKLDKARNRLITLDVMFGMVSMWLTANTVIGGYFGMNLPYGAYTDGTVPPGGKFEPPTGGDQYAGPFGEQGQGPSYEFFYSSVVTSVVTLIGILITWVMLRFCGLTRS